jgi:O-methyltransferase
LKLERLVGDDIQPENHIPGIRGYYTTISRLYNERITLAGQLKAERNTLRAEVPESHGQLSAALTLAQAHEFERNSLRAEVTELHGQLSAARALAQAYEFERNNLRAELTDRLNVLGASITAHVDLILKRLAETQSAAGVSASNISANVLGAGARQEELIARLVRSQRGECVWGDAGIELYLDLLEASLTGALIEDDAHSPWTSGAYDPTLRAIGRDWPRQALTMIGTSRMRNLRMLTMRAVAEGIPGDFIETGVWRGGACIYAKAIFRAMGASDRRVFVADSFRGLPKPDVAANPADAGDAHHTYSELAVPRSEVEAGFRRYGLLDDNVIFLEGWFKDTLPQAPVDRLALLRLDGDMYESTMDALRALYHKVSPGGFVIVDDYILKPCAEAIEDFRRQHRITADMHPVDGAAVWWQVPV